MKRAPITENPTFTFFRPRRRYGPVSLLRCLGENLYYTLFMKADRPKRSEKRTYHISLCIMFKDEKPYLREWIEYHRMMGVDHFYMYDNNSSDGFEAVTDPYEREGVVTLVRWPQEHSQVACYEDCIKNFQSESDWIGFIDVDEFLVPVAEESLAGFLDKFSNRPAVLIYWRFFGSGGMLERDTSRLVMEDFVVASEKLYNKGKCFFNSNFDYYFGYPRNSSMFHYLWTISHGHPVPPVDMFGRTTLHGRSKPAGRKKIPMQLNHYAVKSFYEHREKNKKGDSYYDHPTHGDDVFYMRDKRCSRPDYTIYKYISELKVRLRERDGEI